MQLVQCPLGRLDMAGTVVLANSADPPRTSVSGDSAWQYPKMMSSVPPPASICIIVIFSVDLQLRLLLSSCDDDPFFHAAEGLHCGPTTA